MHRATLMLAITLATKTVCFLPRIRKFLAKRQPNINPKTLMSLIMVSLRVSLSSHWSWALTILYVVAIFDRRKPAFIFVRATIQYSVARNALLTGKSIDIKNY